MGKCDVLKISDNEVEFLFGTTDYDKGAALIREKYNIPLVLITMGKDGSRAYYKDLRVEAAPFLQENTIGNYRRRRYFLRKRSQLCSGAWSGGSDCRKLKRASDLCQRSRFSDHHQKRRRFALCRPEKKFWNLSHPDSNFSVEQIMNKSSRERHTIKKQPGVPFLTPYLF